MCQIETLATCPAPKQHFLLALLSHVDSWLFCSLQRRSVGVHMLTPKLCLVFNAYSFASRFLFCFSFTGNLGTSLPPKYYGPTLRCVFTSDQTITATGFSLSFNSYCKSKLVAQISNRRAKRAVSSVKYCPLVAIGSLL